VLFVLVAVHARIIFRLYNLLFPAIPHAQSNTLTPFHSFVIVDVCNLMSDYTYIAQSFANSEARRSAHWAVPLCYSLRAAWAAELGNKRVLSGQLFFGALTALGAVVKRQTEVVFCPFLLGWRID
jgi:hypothetical protein